MSGFWNIDGSQIASNVSAFSIDGPAYTLLNMPFDAKTCNYYQIEDKVRIEEKAEYLGRISTEYRMPGVFVTMLIPKSSEVNESIEVVIEDFEAALENYDFKIYRFDGGIADYDFKEYVSLSQHVLATNEGLGEYHTISGATAGHVLRASSATEAKFQQLSHADLLLKGTYLHSEIDTHINTLSIHRVINDNGSSNIELFSAYKILSLISESVTGGMLFMGGYNALTDTPVLTGGVGVLKGHTYVVTVGGDIQFDSGDTIVTVTAGDMLIANQNTPDSNTEWTFIIRDIPTVVDATETQKGILKLATNADVSAGIDDTKAVTPLKLKNLGYARKYVSEFFLIQENIINIIHNLNTIDIVVSVRTRAIVPELIECSIKILDVNTIEIEFNNNNDEEYSITIIG